LTRTFVELADSLVDDFDVVELLTTLCERCVELLGASDVGIVLVDERGQLHAMASSTERLHVLELMELQNHEGPCLDAYLTGAPVLNADLESRRWPRFERRAFAAGFRTVHAIPLRHRGESIGAINIFDAHRRTITPEDAAVVQALADIASIAVLQHRALRKARTLSDQLQQALQSRVAIEQAKGILAERLHVDLAGAFSTLRSYSRNRNEPIGDVARQLIDGSLSAERLVAEGRQRRADRHGNPTSRWHQSEDPREASF
jgi:GAF domain-containing protein